MQSNWLLNVVIDDLEPQRLPSAETGLCNKLLKIVID